MGEYGERGVAAGRPVQGGPLDPAGIELPPASNPAVSSTATTASRVRQRAAAGLPPGRGNAVSSASAITMGSNRAEEYAAALASASAVPAAIIQPVASWRSPARTTHHAASATRNTDRAS